MAATVASLSTAAAAASSSSSSSSLASSLGRRGGTGTAAGKCNRRGSRSSRGQRASHIATELWFGSTSLCMRDTDNGPLMDVLQLLQQQEQEQEPWHQQSSLGTANIEGSHLAESELQLSTLALNV
ncbi:hypothetical protein AWZ03_014321 [Drosophila navojoa]|uniref:Uncharacterized protein n=1 Tax=Drosophila navojoa TaxID=7232 RepID=A0A484ASA0_DRONA|nr:hypothetical protein AWZ03_014321 [Drosophila navojoa]